MVKIYLLIYTSRVKLNEIKGMKLNMKKENWIKYGIILGFTIIICQGFLQMHYSSDTYVLWDIGYMNYPQQYFLLDGRIISSIVCFLAGMLKIPFETYIVGMNFIGVIFISIAIYIMSSTIKNIIKPEKKLIEYIIILASFVLVLNQFTLEYLLFPESAVMCLGVLLIVIATKIAIEKPKHSYLKVFITLLIATLCYQGLLNIFPVYIILVYIVKQIVSKNDYKQDEKEFFIEMIKFAIMVIVILLISMFVVDIGINYFESDQDRRIYLIDFEAFLLRGEIVLEYLNELWIKNMNTLPYYINPIVLIITFVSLILLRTKKEIIMQYILFLVVSFAICVVPMYIFNTGPAGRTNSPLMIMWGASLLILLAQSTIVENEIKKKYIYSLIIISFIINSLYTVRNISEHLASNAVEHNMGATIRYKLEEYEKETGITVTKFGYVYDISPQQYAYGIKEMGSLTERKLSCSWSIRQAINFYCDRHFEKVIIPEDIYFRDVVQKDYKQFTDEQIIFFEDQMHLIVY